MTGGMWCALIAVASAVALIVYLLHLRHEDMEDD